jgi:hypothetical protein
MELSVAKRLQVSLARSRPTMDTRLPELTPDAAERIADVLEAARDEFPGDLAVAEDRKHYWIKESQERAANGIVGSVIPIRVTPQHAPVFAELELQFRILAGEKGELQAILFDGTRFNLNSSCSDATDNELHREKFEHLARQATAALDFRFSDSSRAIFYWLQLLKQNSPLLKGGRLTDSAWPLKISAASSKHAVRKRHLLEAKEKAPKSAQRPK